MTAADTAALARRAIGLVDLTDLDDRSSVASVQALCARAVEHGTAAVCVWPDFVATARSGVGDSGVQVATVVNFPSGTERPFAVGVQTERAIVDGADEIDVVLPYGSFVSGDLERAAGVLDTVRAAAGSLLVKVILETGELPDVATVEAAARFAVDHGADFVKTSTGKTPRSASPEAAAAMLRVIASAGRPVGIKPSGGIRTLADAEQYIALADGVMGAGWATPATFRFGASGLLDALLAAVEGDTSASSTSSY